MDAKTAFRRNEMRRHGPVYMNALCVADSERMPNPCQLSSGDTGRVNFQ